MRKNARKIGLLLAICLLTISILQVIQAKATDSRTVDDLVLGQKIPLTGQEIKSRWPNIPSAKELYGKEVCVVVDLRYCGKQVSSMVYEFPDPDSPTVLDMSSIIANYTVNVPNLLHGGIVCSVPQIWLRYNSNVWVTVPLKYLISPGLQTAHVNTWAAKG